MTTATKELRKYVVEVVREYPSAETYRDRVQFSEVILTAVDSKDAHSAAIAEVARLHPKAEKIVIFASRVVR